MRTQRSTIKPSLTGLQCFELEERKAFKNKVTLHAAKYHFSEECSTDAQRSVHRLKSSRVFFLFPSIRSSFTYKLLLFLSNICVGRACEVTLRLSADLEKTNALILQSFNSISAKTICEATDFFFPFCYFIQHHLYTTKPPINCHFFKFFFIKQPHGAPQHCGSRRKKIDHIRRVSES